MNCELRLEMARLVLRDFLEKWGSGDWEGVEQALEALARILLG
ncbi:hypothetical protein [Vulcanisaeta souniana]|uniref:Uncharacterized protein n=1 Tax=Vulcanisaeta souniana JCM 11219 TaxID=1293586 RepID=A0A830EAX3_9CREN|nr:hypothetical protein [Vulcanisaeta souniana]BDR92255.1 hypothetical protein Vsou_13480 [Vulcanisaeta souniana JCM 11219]GGI86241.1 hypothetical protein GCM10007112_24050 [Vulcanisaeta souniana JCM 11219]